MSTHYTVPGFKLTTLEHECPPITTRPFIWVFHSFFFIYCPSTIELHGYGDTILCSIGPTRGIALYNECSYI